MRQLTKWTEPIFFRQLLVVKMKMFRTLGLSSGVYKKITILKTIWDWETSCKGSYGSFKNNQTRYTFMSLGFNASSKQNYDYV